MDLFASQEMSHCPLWFSLTHPAPLGLDTILWPTWLRLHLNAFSLITLLPGVLERVRRDRVLLLLIAPRWPELPIRRDLLSQAGGSIIHPQPELWKLWDWSLRGPSSYTGLSTKVVETILPSRAPSTRKLYVLKWRVFNSWCSNHQLDPVNCWYSAGVHARAFHCRASPVHFKSLCDGHSYHIPLGGMSLGKDPLVSRFLRGTLRCCKPSVLLLFRLRTRKCTICFTQCGH